MLYKFTLCAVYIALFISAVSAQTDDYRKNEFYVGYSNQQIDNGRRTFHGFEGAYTRNLSRYFGIKADVSGAYKNNSFTSNIVEGTTTTTFSAKQKGSLYNFLGGVQIKDNAARTRFKPFAHALVGVARASNKISNVTCSAPSCTQLVFSDSNETGLGGAFGGGLDIKINDKIDFRVLQVDYNPVYTSSTVENNFRFGIGFVFH
jgi:hypothetical protein